MNDEVALARSRQTPGDGRLSAHAWAFLAGTVVATARFDEQYWGQPAKVGVLSPGHASPMISGDPPAVAVPCRGSVVVCVMLNLAVSNAH